MIGDLFRLDGCTAFVSGAAGHLGRSMSRALCEVGVEPLVAYQLLAITSIVDSILLYGFFRTHAPLEVTVARCR